jgi:hypothetical protein
MIAAASVIKGRTTHVVREVDLRRPKTGSLRASARVKVGSSQKVLWLSEMGSFAVSLRDVVT